MSSEYNLQPLPLIEIHDDETLSANEEALKTLKTIPDDCPVSVVCVCGIYRSGKSSLMNWLLEVETWGSSTKGFTVGPSVNRCTRGIWMWGAPKKSKLPSGEECYVIVLDTEGIGGVESNAQYDARIFSLALLLCSSLIYNSMGSIDEAAISNLSFVAQLSQHIHISKKGDDKDGKVASGEDFEDESLEFNKHFPTFTWVIRDFALGLVDEEGDPISGNQYLNKALTPVRKYDMQTQERNRIRSMLSSFFSKRQCVTLVRPCNDEEALQQIDNVPFSDLRDEFKTAMVDLRSLVFDNLVPKTVFGGKALNGVMFSGLVESYVSAVNAGGVPTLSTAWDTISEQECQSALEHSIQTYEAEMNGNCGKDMLPMDDTKLTAFHETNLMVAREFFKFRAVGSSVAEYQTKLEETLKTMYKRYEEANATESVSLCEHLVESLYNDSVAPLVQTGAISTDADYIMNLKKEWMKVQDSYVSTPSKGPSAEKVSATFYLKTILSNFEQYSAQVRDIYGKEMTTLKGEIRDLSNKNATLTSEKDLLQANVDDLSTKLTESERELMNANSRVTQQEATIEELSENLRISKKNEDANIDKLQRSEEKMNSLNARIAEFEAAQVEFDATKLKVANQEEELKYLKDKMAIDAEEAQRVEKSYENLLIKLTGLMATDYVPVDML